MKGILIDPTTQTVRIVDVASGLEAMYEALGCTTIDRAAVNADNDLWVDDEGWLYDDDSLKTRGAFYMGVHPIPFAGRGLILGHDGEGKTTATTLSLYVTKEAVRWVPTDEVPHHNPTGHL